jgi:hypothetical protein
MSLATTRQSSIKPKPSNMSASVSALQMKEFIASLTQKEISQGDGPGYDYRARPVGPFVSSQPIDPVVPAAKALSGNSTKGTLVSNTPIE